MDMDEKGVQTDPIELLLEMTKSGTISPWEVDIVEVTDRFLAEVDRMENLNLKISARTLLYAAMLVKMKSELLMDEEDEDNLIEPLERVLQIADESILDEYPLPRPPFRRKVKRRVSLDELIDELKRSERKVILKTPRKSPKRDEETVPLVDLSHDENLQETVEHIGQKITSMYGVGEKFSFNELVKKIDNFSKVFIFLSLLFLATDEKVSLYQEEVFGELYVMRLS